jgi:hypothetical protein
MSDQVRSPEPESYEPPRLEVLGRVHVLTLRNKAFGLSDGDFFSGQGLITVS